MLFCVAIVCPSSLLCSISLHEYTTIYILIYSTAARYLDYFHFGGLKNNATINILVHINILYKYVHFHCMYTKDWNNWVMGYSYLQL